MGSTQRSESVIVNQGLTVSVALLAAAVAYGATPLAGYLATRLGLHDRPSDRKLHVVLIPYLGGLGILAGWLVAFLTLGTLKESFLLGAGMGVLMLVGLVDDRFDISPRVRLVIQIGVAGVVWWGGVRMTPTELVGVDFVFSMVWLVGITNAFNFMDNMDGLAAGVGGIAAASLGTIGILFGQQLVSLLGFGLAGACAGFLRHNFHPARIFMGDTGSLPLGFGLACLAIKVEFPGVDPLISWAVPVVVLGLFVADTTVMAVGRVLRGEPLIGGRLDHISHRLLQRRASVPSVALTMYGVAAALGFAGVVMARVSTPTAVALGASLAVAVTGGAIRVLRWPILAPTSTSDVPEPVAAAGAGV